MEKSVLKKGIEVAAGRIPADVVIKNCKVADVYSGIFIEGDIAISDGKIAGVGDYEGNVVIDGGGRHALPGFIDSHIHIESSYVSPEELGRLLVPCGGTTIIADPHEIVNVCGLDGLSYMMDAAENTAMDIRLMLPSCVPATPFENAGATVLARDMKDVMGHERILGLGEFMNFPGVVYASEDVLDKLLLARMHNKPIDGHSPGLSGKELNAYAFPLIHTEHECSTVEDLQDRIGRGMYVMLRQGSACHELRTLLKGVTQQNSRRCLLCSDDRQPKTILELGHLNDHLRICVEEGLDAMTAIRMASLNAAECFGLQDRGAIAPGLRADIVLVDDLEQFHVNRVLIQGELVAEEGKYLLPVRPLSGDKVRGSFHVKDFSADKLRLKLSGDEVYVIDVLPGSVVTGKGTATVRRDENGEFVHDPEADIVKVAVIERHKNTGNVAVALLRGYGIRQGAVALSIAHDSHNIIVVGTNDADMAFAVQQLISQGGGVVLARDGALLESMPMPLGGIMSDQSGEWVMEKLNVIHDKAYEALGISRTVEPVMTLCFMSLAVIPELKLTDMGLFDVTRFAFIDINVNE